MITREINIDGKKVKFKASAAVPRIYRAKFGRDIFKDLMSLESEMKDSKEMSIPSLEMFENVAYIMARHADPNQPETAEEWLEQFNTFSIYEVLPEILELWALNIQTDVEAKKKAKRSIGK